MNTYQQANSVDYHWRKSRVTYGLASLALIILSFVALNLYNSRHMCGIAWTDNPGDTMQSPYDACTTAKALGHGTSPGWIVLEIVILVLSYFFVLPRIYRYITPPRITTKNELVN